jgi:hypothetical protein
VADLLPLTRRILAALSRFLEATTDREEQVVVQWCGLDRAEVRALRRLREQWREAGAVEGLFQAPGVLKPGVLAQMLDGFAWREDVERSLARLFGREALQQQFAVLSGLADERRRRAMENGTGTPAALTDRLEALCRERGIDVMRNMAADTRRELAEALSTTAGTVGTTLSRLRKRNGRERETLRPLHVKEVLDQPPAPRDALKDLRAVLIAEGLRSVEPEGLREPLRVLLAEEG